MKDITNFDFVDMSLMVCSYLISLDYYFPLRFLCEENVYAGDII